MVVWDDIQQARRGPTYRELLEADDECTLTRRAARRGLRPAGRSWRASGVLFERVEGLEF